MMRSMLALLTLALVAGCSPSTPDATQDAAAGEQVASLPAQAPAAALPDTGLPVITVYKSPTCGCCRGWVDHVKEAGFEVEVHDVADVNPYKDEAGVPSDARSCHTAVVGGYALEGHVPAETIKRLLAEKPAVAGLAVPGMPVGSPGMEVPGQAPDKYDVVTFTADGETAVYQSY